MCYAFCQVLNFSKRNQGGSWNLQQFVMCVENQIKASE